MLAAIDTQDEKQNTLYALLDILHIGIISIDRQVNH